MQTAQSLRSFYLICSAVAYAWLAGVAFTGPHAPVAGALLLGAYALWDAIANGLDIARSSAGADLRGQRLNCVVSTLAAVAIASGVHFGFGLSVIAFGVWAFGAGVLQLLVGIRRRDAIRGQWLMIASGAQSAFAGAVFTYLGFTETPAMAAVFGYAAFGATYFLAAALWLAFKAEPRVAATV